MMRNLAVFIFSVLLFGGAADASPRFGPPILSVVAHEQENGSDEEILIYITNFQDEQFEFERLEIHWLEKLSSGGFVVQDFRYNALCKCSESCTNDLIVMKPWETRKFHWDVKDNGCQKAKPGKYQVEAVGKCNADGCYGTYYPTIGNEFDLQ